MIIYQPDPYSCPRCGINLPNLHELSKDRNNDPNGWICADNTVVWIHPSGWEVISHKNKVMLVKATK